MCALQAKENVQVGVSTLNLGFGHFSKACWLLRGDQGRRCPPLAARGRAPLGEGAAATCAWGFCFCKRKAEPSWELWQRPNRRGCWQEIPGLPRECPPTPSPRARPGVSEEAAVRPAEPLCAPGLGPGFLPRAPISPEARWLHLLPAPAWSVPLKGLFDPRRRGSAVERGL